MSTSTSILVARCPARVTAAAVSRTEAGTTASTAAWHAAEVGAGVDQRAEQHVAGDPGRGVDPGVPAPGRPVTGRAAIWAARWPAP